MSKFVKPEGIVKLKLLGFIQQIIATFFVFFSAKVFFLSILKRIFPLSHIFFFVENDH